MPTYSPKPGEITRAWHVIDATDVVLGRLATHAATLLRGKHKPTYAPHMDTGDFVVIVNAETVAVAQSKRDNEFVYRHSGYPGGLRLAIARALCEFDGDDRPALKKAGFLTRDARVKESKKYGLKKARKAPQYSKR